MSNINCLSKNCRFMREGKCALAAVYKTASIKNTSYSGFNDRRPICPYFSKPA